MTLEDEDKLAKLWLFDIGLHIIRKHDIISAKGGDCVYKLCRTEQSARRQQEIEEGLLAMMQKLRYEDISVSDLCLKLDIPRKSFYRYFGSKEDALYGLLDHRLMEYDSKYSGTVTGNMPGIALNLNWFFEFWLTQKDLLDALQRSNISGILVERAIQNSQRAEIFEYARDGYSHADVEMITSFTVCGLMSIVLHWHHEGYKESPKEMAETAYKMLNRPLISNLEI